MGAKVRLTEKAVEKILAPPGVERIEIVDTYLPSLELRITASKRKSWSVLYRVAGAGERGTRGKLRRLTLGRHPLLDLKAAREKAREALDAADRGIDPAVQRATEIETRQTRTFEAVFERFVELHAKQNTKKGRFAKGRAAALAAAQEGQVTAKPKGPTSQLGRVAAERIIADNALPTWRGRLIETITRAEVHDLLDDIVTSKGEALARELRKHLTKCFNWAADRGHVAASPLAGIRMCLIWSGRSWKRTRFLRVDIIRATYFRT